jgi:preprotein translocase subunit SecG
MALAGILILVVFIITAVLLVLIVLIQDDQGGGIGGMFGGGESSSPFGSRTGNVLTKFTSVLGAVFLVAAFALAWLNRTPDQDGFLERARLQQTLQAEEGQWWVRPAPAPPALAPQAETTEDSGQAAAPEGQASGGTIGQAEAADTSGDDTTSAEGSS